jgi:hypothetical protein
MFLNFYVKHSIAINQCVLSNTNMDSKSIARINPDKIIHIKN